MTFIKYLPKSNVISKFYALILLLILSCSSEYNKTDNFLKKGKELHEQGKCIDAIRFFNKGIFIENNLPETRKSKLIELHLAKGDSYFCFNITDTALIEYKEALKIGESIYDSLNIAICNKKIGKLNRKLKNNSEAIKNYNKYIKYFQKIDEKDKTISVLLLKSIAQLYDNTSKKECLELANYALNLAEQINEPQLIYESIFNLGLIHYLTKNDSCLIFYNKAIDFAKNSKIENLSFVYSNIANFYNRRQNDNQKSIEFLKKTIELEKKENNNLNRIAISLANIGKNYHKMNNLEIARTYYKDALDIFKEIGNKKTEGKVLGNYISVLLSLNQAEYAIPYINNFSIISLLFNDSIDLANSYTKLGNAYLYLKKYDSAITCYKNSKEIYEKYNNNFGLAVCLNSLSATYSEHNKYNEALKYLLDVEAIFKHSGDVSNLIILYSNIGAVLNQIENYNEAKKYLIKSISLIEEYSSKMEPKIQLNFFSYQITSYHRLISSYYYTGDIDSVFNTIELCKAKVLDKRLKTDNTQRTTLSINDIQKSIEDSMGIIIFSTSDYSYITQMYISEDTACVERKQKADFVSAIIPKIKPNFRKYLETNFSETELEELSNYDSTSDKNINKRLFLQIVSFYRSLLSTPLTEPDLLKTQRQIGQELYKFLIANLDKEIIDRPQLLIVPDGMFSLLPFEALINQNNKYFIEEHNISYIQSMKTLELIKNRHSSSGKKDILIFGGTSQNNNIDTIEIAENEVINFEQIEKDLFEGKEIKNLQKIYKQLGINKMCSLVGSEREIVEISRIFPEAEYFINSDVTEYMIKKLSEKSSLQDYKIIHFSSHGVAVQKIPQLSAIILSQVDDMKNEDGFLRIDEIYKLKLNADFVNLSACETGNGKIYVSEGVVGLSQAFLIAGANSVSSTLWSVADVSTASFVSELYTLIESENISYSMAINKIKRNFIKGKYDSYWTQPFYWAPFVFYGNYNTKYN